MMKRMRLPNTSEKGAQTRGPERNRKGLDERQESKLTQSETKDKKRNTKSDNFVRNAIILQKAVDVTGICR